MSTQTERAERARAGSKRKRDLDALAAEEGKALTHEQRLDWAEEHLPEFNSKLVSAAMCWAERRPDAPDPITVEAVREQLDRWSAVPLEEAPPSVERAGGAA